MIVIDDADRADARRRKILQHRRTQPSGPDDQHPRALQFLLTGATEFRQDDVARIALQFVGRKQCGFVAAHRRTIEQFQEKWEPVFHPELRRNRELERFTVPSENENRSGVTECRCQAHIPIVDAPLLDFL